MCSLTELTSMDKACHNLTLKADAVRNDAFFAVSWGCRDGLNHLSTHPLVSEG